MGCVEVRGEKGGRLAEVLLEEAAIRLTTETKSKVTAPGDCNCEIKMPSPWKKS